MYTAYCRVSFIRLSIIRYSRLSDMAVVSKLTGGQFNLLTLLPNSNHLLLAVIAQYCNVVSSVTWTSVAAKI